MYILGFKVKFLESEDFFFCVIVESSDDIIIMTAAAQLAVGWF